MTDYSTMAAEIHASNITAGWWPADTSQRNRGEVMMLIVSEVAEAAEGRWNNLPDDKLPHRRMFDVELADTAIRLYDLIGADAPEGSFDQSTCDNQILMTGNPDAELMKIVWSVSHAMEAHRKGRREAYGQSLWNALGMVYAVATLNQVELETIIAEKRAFNAVREDHKIENRQKAGGKAY